MLMTFFLPVAHFSRTCEPQLPFKNVDDLFLLVAHFSPFPGLASHNFPSKLLMTFFAHRRFFQEMLHAFLPFLVGRKGSTGEYRERKFSTIFSTTPSFSPEVIRRAAK
jgi:hypothetical protein